jgi:surface protein
MIHLTTHGTWSAPVPVSSTALTLFVDTTQPGSANNTFILPCENTGTYNATIDWGDSSSNIITTYNDANLTHVYSTPGTYTIKITGSLPYIKFNNSGDKLKLIDITQWGTWQPQSLQKTFMGCSNLTGSFTDNLDLSSITDPSLLYCFFNCSSFNGNISSWTTTPFTAMNYMFYGCSLFNQNIGGWNVSNVTNFFGMFFGCSLFNQDISGWSTSNATAFQLMFYGCSSFNQNIGGWSTSNVTNMQQTFFGCSSFNQDISGWNYTNVTSMLQFLNGATSFSTANYDLLLNSLAGQSVQSNVPLGVSSTQYTISVSGTSHTFLTGTKLWTITDLGGI